MVLDMLELQHYSCVQFAGLYELCADLLFKCLFIAYRYCDNNQSPLNRYATSVFTDMESAAQKIASLFRSHVMSGVPLS